MPTPGLSLVGFMDQQQAINYFRAACIPADPTDVALIAEWNAAKARLGAPVADCGQPDILPIPPADQAYIQQLQQEPWVQQALVPWPGASFRVYSALVNGDAKAFELLVDLLALMRALRANRIVAPYRG